MQNKFTLYPSNVATFTLFPEDLIKKELYSGATTWTHAQNFTTIPPQESKANLHFFSPLRPCSKHLPRAKKYQQPWYPKNEQTEMGRKMGHNPTCRLQANHGRELTQQQLHLAKHWSNRCVAVWVEVSGCSVLLEELTFLKLLLWEALLWQCTGQCMPGITEFFISFWQKYRNQCSFEFLKNASSTGYLKNFPAFIHWQHSSVLWCILKSARLMSVGFPVHCILSPHSPWMSH